MYACVQFSSVQSLSRVRLFETPWITARQSSLSITNSRSSLRLTSIESVVPSSHLILCRPLLLLPPIPPSIRVFSNESTLNEDQITGFSSLTPKSSKTSPGNWNYSLFTIHQFTAPGYSALYKRKLQNWAGRFWSVPASAVLQRQRSCSVERTFPFKRDVRIIKFS